MSKIPESTNLASRKIEFINQRKNRNEVTRQISRKEEGCTPIESEFLLIYLLHVLCWPFISLNVSDARSPWPITTLKVFQFFTLCIFFNKFFGYGNSII